MHLDIAIKDNTNATEDCFSCLKSHSKNCDFPSLRYVGISFKNCSNIHNKPLIHDIIYWVCKLP